jgi:hypothetical protein
VLPLPWLTSTVLCLIHQSPSLFLTPSLVGMHHVWRLLPYSTHDCMSLAVINLLFFSACMADSTWQALLSCEVPEDEPLAGAHSPFDLSDVDAPSPSHSPTEAILLPDDPPEASPVNPQPDSLAAIETMGEALISRFAAEYSLDVNSCPPLSSILIGRSTDSTELLSLRLAYYAVLDACNRLSSQQSRPIASHPYRHRPRR